MKPLLHVLRSLFSVLLFTVNVISFACEHATPIDVHRSTSMSTAPQVIQVDKTGAKKLYQSLVGDVIASTAHRCGAIDRLGSDRCFEV